MRARGDAQVSAEVRLRSTWSHLGQENLHQRSSPRAHLHVPNCWAVSGIKVTSKTSIPL